jgi:hypothetical protein
MTHVCSSFYLYNHFLSTPAVKTFAHGISPSIVTKHQKYNVYSRKKITKLSNSCLQLSTSQELPK